MNEPLKIAVVGVGRMGPIHALHTRELENDTGQCILAAIVDRDLGRPQARAAELGGSARACSSIDEMLASGVAEASVLATITELHREHSTRLISAGHRVMMEKPLTGTLDGDPEFSAELDRTHPDSLMLAFQRRFDPPLHYAKKLLDSGIIDVKPGEVVPFPLL